MQLQYQFHQFLNKLLCKIESINKLFKLEISLKFAFVFENAFIIPNFNIIEFNLFEYSNSNFGKYKLTFELIKLPKITFKFLSVKFDIYLFISTFFLVK